MSFKVVIGTGRVGERSAMKRGCCNALIVGTLLKQEGFLEVISITISAVSET